MTYKLEQLTLLDDGWEWGGHLLKDDLPVLRVSPAAPATGSQVAAQWRQRNDGRRRSRRFSSDRLRLRAVKLDIGVILKERGTIKICYSVIGLYKFPLRHCNPFFGAYKWFLQCGFLLLFVWSTCCDVHPPPPSPQPLCSTKTISIIFKILTKTTRALWWCFRPAIPIGLGCLGCGGG